MTARQVTTVMAAISPMPSQTSVDREAASMWAGSAGGRGNFTRAQLAPRHIREAVRLESRLDRSKEYHRGLSGEDLGIQFGW